MKRRVFCVSAHGTSGNRSEEKYLHWGQSQLCCTAGERGSARTPVFYYYGDFQMESSSAMWDKLSQRDQRQTEPASHGRLHPAADWKLTTAAVMYFIKDVREHERKEQQDYWVAVTSDAIHSVFFPNSLNQNDICRSVYWIMKINTYTSCSTNTWTIKRTGV